MGSLTIILLLSAFSAGVAQERNSTIIAGSSLNHTSQPWLSPSGLYAFGFLKQGDKYALGMYLAGVLEETVVWTADPRLPANVTLWLTRGGLVSREPIGGEIVQVVSSSNVASASMLDNGNFVLYNSDQQIVWQSFDHPTDTLLPGQRLATEHELISSASTTDYSRGYFRLRMQADGNLVQYPADTINADSAYYASGTDDQGDNVTLNIADDGHMYLLGSTRIIMNMTEGGYPKGKGIYLVRIDADGIFRLYFHSLDRQGNWSIIWSSTEDKCLPKGLCGINMFCDYLINNETVCICFPDFERNDPTNDRLGCGRNDTSENCKTEDPNLTQGMTSLEHLFWQIDQFGNITTNEKEVCEKACVEDCLCVAAFFDQGICYKQKQPIRYGRRSLSSDAIALIKAADNAPSAQRPSASALGPSASDLEKQPKKGMPVYGIVIIVVCAAALVSLFLWFFCPRKMNCFRGARKHFGDQTVEVNEKGDDNLLLFSFSSIEIATDHFSDENKLG